MLPTTKSCRSSTTPASNPSDRRPYDTPICIGTSVDGYLTREEGRAVSELDKERDAHADIDGRGDGAPDAAGQSGSSSPDETEPRESRPEVVGGAEPDADDRERDDPDE